MQFAQVVGAIVGHRVALEPGHVLTKNLWLSVGYNHFGFRDDDLAPDGFTDKGVFLRLRYKFDENLLN